MSNKTADGGTSAATEELQESGNSLGAPKQDEASKSQKNTSVAGGQSKSESAAVTAALAAPAASAAASSASLNATVSDAATAGTQIGVVSVKKESTKSSNAQIRARRLSIKGESKVKPEEGTVIPVEIPNHAKRMAGIRSRLRRQNPAEGSSALTTTGASSPTTTATGAIRAHGNSPTSPDARARARMAAAMSHATLKATKRTQKAKAAAKALTGKTSVSLDDSGEEEQPGHQNRKKASYADVSTVPAKEAVGVNGDLQRDSQEPAKDPEPTPEPAKVVRGRGDSLGTRYLMRHVDKGVRDDREWEDANVETFPGVSLKPRPVEEKKRKPLPSAEEGASASDILAAFRGGWKKQLGAPRPLVPSSGTGNANGQEAGKASSSSKATAGEQEASCAAGAKTDDQEERKKSKKELKAEKIKQKELKAAEAEERARRKKLTHVELERERWFKEKEKRDEERAFTLKGPSPEKKSSSSDSSSSSSDRPPEDKKKRRYDDIVVCGITGEVFDRRKERLQKLKEREQREAQEKRDEEEREAQDKRNREEEESNKEQEAEPATREKSRSLSKARKRSRSPAATAHSDPYQTGLDMEAPIGRARKRRRSSRLHNDSSEMPDMAAEFESEDDEPPPPPLEDPSMGLGFGYGGKLTELDPHGEKEETASLARRPHRRLKRAERVHRRTHRARAAPDELSAEEQLPGSVEEFLADDAKFGKLLSLKMKMSKFAKSQHRVSENPTAERATNQRIRTGEASHELEEARAAVERAKKRRIETGEEPQRKDRTVRDAIASDGLQNGDSKAAAKVPQGRSRVLSRLLAAAKAPRTRKPLSAAAKAPSVGVTAVSLMPRAAATKTSGVGAAIAAAVTAAKKAEQMVVDLDGDESIAKFSAPKHAEKSKSSSVTINLLVDVEEAQIKPTHTDSESSRAGPLPTSKAKLAEMLKEKEKQLQQLREKQQQQQQRIDAQNAEKEAGSPAPVDSFLADDSKFSKLLALKARFAAISGKTQPQPRVTTQPGSAVETKAVAASSTSRAIPTATEGKEVEHVDRFLADDDKFKKLRNLQTKLMVGPSKDKRTTTSPQ